MLGTVSLPSPHTSPSEHNLLLLSNTSSAVAASAVHHWTARGSFHSEKNRKLLSEGLLQDPWSDSFPRWWDNSASQICTDVPHFENSRVEGLVNCWSSTICLEELTDTNKPEKQRTNANESEEVTRDSGQSISGQYDIIETGDIACSLSSSAQAWKSSCPFQNLSTREALNILGTGLFSVEDFISILYRCRKEKNLTYARLLYLHISSRGLSTLKIVEDHVVPMFVECGSVSDAELVFYRSVHRGEHSLTSLILGYSENGRPMMAFNLYVDVEEGIGDQSIYTFLALLKVCTKLKDVDKGHRIHSEIICKGLERDKMLGRGLINMYSGCGYLLDANGLLHSLPVQDVALWTALITGYVEHGSCQEALKCFELMKEKGLSPTMETFACTLRACSKLGADEGQEIHSEAITKGFEQDAFVGSILVCMYAKFGLILEAQKVFDQLPFRDVVSWNALIAGYSECQDHWHAFMCFERMCLEGHSPDAVTYVCSIRICTSLGALRKGQEMHSEILQKGLENELSVGQSLVDMYSKCGCIREAENVSDMLKGRDAATYTSLIVGYVERGLGQDALNCFECMSNEKICPDAVTYACSLRACCSIEALEKGQQVHMEIAHKGFEKDVSIGNTLVSMYARCGLLADALDVFNRLLEQNVVLWTALIGGYTDHGPVEEALNLFRKMQSEGVAPNSVTYSCVLKACGVLGNVEIGQELHVEVVLRGYEADLAVGNTLVGMYSNLVLLSEAQEVFDMLLVPDAVSWNALIGGYAEHGPGQKALACFEEMQLQGISPDFVTLSCAFKACGSIGAIDRGREIHMKYAKSLIGKHLIIGNSLINMYAKCGSLSEAWGVFNKLSVKDVASWSSIIGGLGLNHEGDMAIACFEEMQAQGIAPDLIVFTCLLTACSHASMVMRGRTYFRQMREKYGVVPSTEHYACMVDLLARSGHLYEAEQFLLMWCPQCEGSWVALLSACRRSGETELGYRCFQELVGLNPDMATWYRLMTDAYISAGMLDDADRIEKIRMHVGAYKKPASTLIEVNKKTYEFQVGCKYNKELAVMLNTIKSRAKADGYLPNI